MPEVITFDFLHPVVPGKLVEHDGQVKFDMEPPFILGTTFPIGGGFYMTAEHVVRGSQLGTLAIGFKAVSGRDVIVRPVEAVEAFPAPDIAIMRVREPDEWGGTTQLHPWQSPASRAPMGADVRAAGYPFAFDMERLMLVVRAFKGYIVSDHLVDNIYELSFMCPKGLSGAPLFVVEPGAWKIGGVILATRRTQMLVADRVEVITEPAKETRYETYDAYTLGIARASYAIMNLESKLLGGTVEAHLRGLGLV